MAVRTSLDLVQGVIAGIDDDADISGFIDTANMIVNALCQAAYEANDPTNAAAQLTLIETWLTAHLWSCDNSRLMYEVIGRGRDMIEGKVGLGLQLTHHGQQLYNGIDFLGTLSSFGQPRKKVKVVWLGRDRVTRRSKLIGPGWYRGWGWY